MVLPCTDRPVVSKTEDALFAMTAWALAFASDPVTISVAPLASSTPLPLMAAKPTVPVPPELSIVPFRVIAGVDDPKDVVPVRSTVHLMLRW